MIPFYNPRINNSSASSLSLIPVFIPISRSAKSFKYFKISLIQEQYFSQPAIIARCTGYLCTPSISLILSSVNPFLVRVHA